MRPFYKGIIAIGAVLFASACSSASGDNKYFNKYSDLLSGPYRTAAGIIKFTGQRLTKISHLEECTENGHNPNINQSRYSVVPLGNLHFATVLYCSGNVDKNPHYVIGPNDMLVIIDINYLGRQINVTRIYDMGINGLGNEDFYSFEEHTNNEEEIFELQSISTLKSREDKDNLTNKLDAAILRILKNLQEI